MDAPFSLDWGDSVHAKIVAYNVYGDSEESDVGNGAVIFTMPDKPINLAEVVAERSANSISIVWEDGFNDGGTEVLDYQVWHDQGTGDWIVIEEYC